MELFAKVTQKGLTFKTVKGTVSVQDLWQMPLTSKNGFDLDTVSREVLRKVRETQEDSLVSQVKPDTDDQLRLDVLKHIIEFKQDDIKRKEEAKAAESHNSRIDEFIQRKKEEQLASMSIEELENLRK